MKKTRAATLFLSEKLREPINTDNSNTVTRLDRGMSLVEVMLAVIIFVLGFIPLMRLFSETGLSQQRMARDFPVTLSIAERILMTIENEIEEGRFDTAMFNSGGDDGVDITESVIENREVSMALENFYGTDNQSATKFITKCRVLLSSKPGPDPNLVVVTIRFLWNDRNYDSNNFTHNITLHLLKNKD